MCVQNKKVNAIPFDSIVWWDEAHWADQKDVNAKIVLYSSATPNFDTITVPIINDFGYNYLIANSYLADIEVLFCHIESPSQQVFNAQAVNTLIAELGCKYCISFHNSCKSAQTAYDYSVQNSYIVTSQFADYADRIK
jgi:hypothetical protein